METEALPSMDLVSGTVYLLSCELQTFHRLYSETNWKLICSTSRNCYSTFAAPFHTCITTCELALRVPRQQYPLPFRPVNPALCGSRPLVTPYYCRLGYLLYVISRQQFWHTSVNMCAYVYFIVYVVWFFFPFSALTLLVGSFDLQKPSAI